MKKYSLFQSNDDAEINYFHPTRANLNFFPVAANDLGFNTSRITSVAGNWTLSESDTATLQSLNMFFLLHASHAIN